MGVMLELSDMELAALRRLLAFVSAKHSEGRPIDQAELAADFSEGDMQCLQGIWEAFESYSKQGP